MLSLLYDIFISPLMVGMNFVLVNAYSILHSYGLAIVVLSLVVNTVLLPLYHMADKWQQEEREKQNKMADKVAEIKQAFQGQERFMMLKTLYRQNHYHPIMAVRNSVGFLIQVPFFFAAYQLLSHFPALNGQSFGPFANLGLPDGLLTIGDLHINVMPFVMTGINLLSAFVYTKGLSSKDKIQLYVFAGIFLVLLYTSPVGLVLYWTLNNAYSLGKNIWSSISNYLSKFSSLLLLAKNGYFTVVGFVFFSILLSYYLPGGVTQQFFSGFILNSSSNLRFISYMLILSITILSIFVLFGNEFKINKKRESININDITISVFIILPIVQYFITNKDVISLKEIVLTCVYLYYVVFSLIILTPIILSKFLSKKIIQCILFILLSLICYMPSVSSYYHWYAEGQTIPILKLSFILYVLYMLFSYDKKNISRVMFYIVILIFLSNSFFSYINGKENTTSNSIESTASNTIKNKDIVLKKTYPMLNDKPNIYLLTYDAYVNNETLNQYGIDNSKQEDFLKNNGFTLYDSYTVSISSIESMGSVFELKNGELGNRYNVAGYATVFSILKNNGYNISAILTPYFFQNVKSGYDYSFPKYENAKSATEHLIKSILMGYMSEGELMISKFNNFNHEKTRFLSSPSHFKPQFLYSHDNLPGHSPDIGSCRKFETNFFGDRLKQANEIMVSDVNNIIKNDPNAIIIINGDHGPRLTKNCDVLSKGAYKRESITRLDMQDRYGSFLAVRMAKNTQLNITMLQDIFPEIFNKLSNSNGFDKLKINPITLSKEFTTNGVYIDNGIIHGGKNNGEKLYLGENHAE